MRRRLWILFLLLSISLGGVGAGCGDDAPSQSQEGHEKGGTRARAAGKGKGVQKGKAAKGKRGQKAPGERRRKKKGAQENAETLPTPPPWPSPASPDTVERAEGEWPILAELRGNVLIPMATHREGGWIVEEVLTLDKLPEGRAGKSLDKGMVNNWWARLTLKPGDVFDLRGDHGAVGTFTVRQAFATGDRGGCTGLVWAIPGEIEWTTPPSGDTRSPEHVWAFRGGFHPPALSSAKLTPPQRKALRATLDTFRKLLEASQEPLPKGGRWMSCDSLSKPACTGDAAAFYVVDMEQDGTPEVFVTVQLKPFAKSGGLIPGKKTIQTALLLGLRDDNAYILGQWDASNSRIVKAGATPTFAGLIDMTGDGRAEPIFRTLEREVENWEVFQAGKQPGTWISIMQTTFPGC